jgi:hypothetical protein
MLAWKDADYMGMACHTYPLVVQTNERGESAVSYRLTDRN